MGDDNQVLEDSSTESRSMEKRCRAILGDDKGLWKKYVVLEASFRWRWVVVELGLVRILERPRG